MAAQQSSHYCIKGHEQLLEPVLRKWRIMKCLPFIRQFPRCRLLDIGCGWNARFLRALEPFIACGVGIDEKAPAFPAGTISTRRLRLGSTLPFPDGSFDVVTMLAVLEHLAEPEAIVQDIRRVLAPGGYFCGTVPSQMAKPVLEFLSYRLHIVNPKEIADHKRYFNKTTLQLLFAQAGLEMVKHRYFQCGMNNFFVARN